MSRKTIIIAIIIIAAALILVIALLGYSNATSFESRLEKEMEYQEILLRYDECALVRIDDDSVAFVENPGALRSSNGKPYNLLLYIEFDLNTHKTVADWAISRDTGELRNDYAEQARQEHYAYSDFYGRKGIGPPPYNIYMGLSSTEPSYENIGPGTSELRCVELDGMYYFMFLEDRSVYY